MQHPDAPSAAPLLYPLGVNAGSSPPRLRAVRQAPLRRTADDWQRALAAVDWTGRDPARGNARVLKAGRKSTVWRATLVFPGGQTLDAVLKVERRVGMAGILRALLRETRADRQWIGARRLARKNVACNECVAVLDAPGVRTLVLRAVDAPTLLEVLAQESVPTRTQHAIARATAEQLRLMWRRPVFLFNSDHKPSNVLVSAASDTHAALLLLDTGGIVPWGIRLIDDCEDDRVQMVAALFIEPTGCGVPIRRTLAMRVLRVLQSGATGEFRGTRAEQREALRDAWHAVAEAVAAHGDPTPEDNPLAPPRRAWELDPALAPPA